MSSPADAAGERGERGPMKALCRAFPLAASVACGGMFAPAAEAKCPLPSAVLAPAWGKVPPRPVLELALSNDRARELGGPPRILAWGPARTKVAVTVTPDTAAAGMDTFRVEVASEAAGPLDVELVDTAGVRVRSWSLEIDPAWRARHGSLAPIQVNRVVESWTCSYTRVRTLSFDGSAWAYRVVAASSPADLAAGRTRSFVVPRSIRLFWEGDASAPLPAVNLELGYSNCFGDTFDWALGAVVVNVFALQPDGTEEPVTAQPLSIAPP